MVKWFVLVLVDDSHVGVRKACCRCRRSEELGYVVVPSPNGDTGLLWHAKLAGSCLPCLWWELTSCSRRHKRTAISGNACRLKRGTRTAGVHDNGNCEHVVHEGEKDNGWMRADEAIDAYAGTCSRDWILIN